MPIIRIGNYEVPNIYHQEHHDDAAEFWRDDVHSVLWKAIRTSMMPGLEQRDSVTFVFEAERENYEIGSVNPQTAYIIIDGLEDREDRPVALRLFLARALGEALIECLPEGWQVEVLPKRYNSRCEGAVLVGGSKVASQPVAVNESIEPKVSGLRYRFRIVVQRDDEKVEEVWTAPYVFADAHDLATAIVNYGRRNSVLDMEPYPMLDTLLHPAFQLDGIDVADDDHGVILEVIRMP